MAFFKNDTSFSDLSQRQYEKPAVLKYVWVKIDISNGYYGSLNDYFDILDEIFPSCSGNYYVQFWDPNRVSFIPISIEYVSLVDTMNLPDSFVYNHLEEYKSKSIRTKKLNRICQ